MAGTQKFVELLLRNIEEEIPVILIKEKHFVFDSFIRGYHAYMGIWEPKIGDEDFTFVNENDNQYDQFAIAVTFEGRTVGHVPKNLSKILNRFTKIPSCELKCRVTGKRVNRGAGYGLEIPVSYTLIGVEKAIDWAQKNIEKTFVILDKKVEKCKK